MSQDLAMGKRKLEVDETVPPSVRKEPRTVFKANDASKKTTTVQIVTGSYERVLHGFTATVPEAAQNDSSPEDPVHFSDNFLFNAHASAIRCLAISPVARGDPSQPQKVILASGGTDERVNLYNLSLSPPSNKEGLASVPTLAGKSIAESSKNRELGSLLHHTSSITALHFSSRSKLLSAAEDNTITVTRVRDWALVSTIKVPQPKVQGRPSGDSAPYGAAPTGVNDFAVHPSMKLMLSVGKGEKCMRLWNLVTGKKAGVLNFGKEILQGVGEGRWGAGEGRKIQWNGRGDQYAVAFERGAVVFGLDSKPICKLLPKPQTKLHSLCYLSDRITSQPDQDVIAVSTEDGRIVFYSTAKAKDLSADGGDSPIPNAAALGQLQANSTGATCRIKDFEILDVSQNGSPSGQFLLITGSSNGEVQLWQCSTEELRGESVANGDDQGKSNDALITKRVGRHRGTYETGNRLTCLRAFVMGDPDEDEEEEDSFEGFDTQGATSNEDSSGSDER